jgi:hypothetical protein
MIKEVLDGGQTISNDDIKQYVQSFYHRLDKRSSSGEQYSSKIAMSQHCTNNSNRGSKYAFTIRVFKH